MLRRWTSTDQRVWVGALALAVGIGLPIAWYLGSPLFINQTVNESFPAVMQAQAPTIPIAQRSGRFTEIDTIHKGTGTATIFGLADGKTVLRFQEFEVQNGPDLYVYLSAHPAPRDTGQLHQGAAYEVARLKGNIGDQNYNLPSDLDLSQFKSVVIYCKRFTTVFSTAELASSP